MHQFINKVLRKTIKSLSHLQERLSAKSHADPPGTLGFSIHRKDDFGEQVYQVKPPTVEYINPLPVHDLLQGGTLQLICPEQNITRYENAVVFPFSDFIISGDKAVWDKYHHPLFSKNSPQDRDLVRYHTGRIYVEMGTEIIHCNRALSLCGVYSDTWSHFMIQYLPNLYSALQCPGLLSEGLTLITPDYSDPHVRYLVTSFLHEHPEITWKPLKAGQAARCDVLYNPDSATYMIEHEQYVSYADMVVPARVASVLKDHFVDKIIQKFGIRGGHPVKLFISRSDAGYRNLLNHEEIESFFLQQGFISIEPHKLDFKRKAELFYNAEIVTGPYSAGFSNLVFSKPGARVLILTNIQRSLEPYLSFFGQHFDLEMLAVTGNDLEPANSQGSFEISLSRVKESYFRLINPPTN